MSSRLFSSTEKIDAQAAADRTATMWIRNDEQAANHLEEVLDYLYLLEDFRVHIPKEEQESYQTMIEAAMNLGDGVLQHLKG